MYSIDSEGEGCGPLTCIVHVYISTSAWAELVATPACPDEGILNSFFIPETTNKIWNEVQYSGTSCGHHWDRSKCPDYRGVLITECPDYRGVLITECPDDRGVISSD